MSSPPIQAAGRGPQSPILLHRWPMQRWTQASRLAPCGNGGVKSVSTRVSPVELVGCLPTGHMTVAAASCPQATIPPEQEGRWGVLPFRGGTLCRAARGLSPGGLISSLMQSAPGGHFMPPQGMAPVLPWLSPRWPFVLRPYLLGTCGCAARLSSGG